MKKYVSLVLLLALCCAIPAFAVRGVIAEDSAANYTAATFVNGANLGTGFQPWEFWNASPTLANCTDGWAIGNINSTNGVAFRFARDGVDGDPHWGYCNGYRGFDALQTGDVLTFKFACAYCAGGRGLDLFGNNGHRDPENDPENSDKIANVIHLSGNNIYSVNGVTVSEDWAPNAISEVTVEQLDDGIELTVKRTLADGTVDVNYTTNIPSTKGPLTGIGLYAGGWEWKDGEDVENYAFYVNDLQIEGELPEKGNLSLADYAFALTPAATNVTFTVSVDNAPAEDLQVNVTVTDGRSSGFVKNFPRSVTIEAGQTSATFEVEVQIAGNNDIAGVSVSAEGYGPARKEIFAPNFTRNDMYYFDVTRADPDNSRWDDCWNLDAGDSITFYVNNNARWSQAANPYLVAVTDSDALTCTSALADNWQESTEGDFEAWTYATLTAGEVDTDTRVHLQVKFGDDAVILYKDDEEGLGCGFTVHAPAAPIVLSADTTELTVGGAPATVTITANDMDTATLLVKTSDDGTYVTIGDGFPFEVDDNTWEGTFTVTPAAPGTATITVYDDQDDTIFAEITFTVSEFVRALSLAPVAENGWAVLSPDTNVSFVVSCNQASDADIVLEVATSALDGYDTTFDATVPASVVIPAGQTSATFDLPVKATGNNCGLNVIVSDTADGGYAAAEYGIHGPKFRWSRSTPDTGDASWILPLGTEVTFWINNDDNTYEAANAFVTATVKGTAITLDPWADASPDPGQFTSGKFTASAAGEWKLIVKYGDAQLFDWGYYVEGGGDTLSVNIDSATFAGGKVTLTADQDLTGNTATVYATADLANPDWQPAGTATIDGATITVEGLSLGEDPLFLRIGQ